MFWWWYTFCVQYNKQIHLYTYIFEGNFSLCTLWFIMKILNENKLRNEILWLSCSELFMTNIFCGRLRGKKVPFLCSHWREEILLCKWYQGTQECRLLTHEKCLLLNGIIVFFYHYRHYKIRFDQTRIHRRDSTLYSDDPCNYEILSMNSNIRRRISVYRNMAHSLIALNWRLCMFKADEDVTASYHATMRLIKSLSQSLTLLWNGSV